MTILCSLSQHLGDAHWWIAFQSSDPTGEQLWGFIKAAELTGQLFVVLYYYIKILSRSQIFAKWSSGICLYFSCRKRVLNMFNIPMRQENLPPTKSVGEHLQPWMKPDAIWHERIFCYLHQQLQLFTPQSDRSLTNRAFNCLMRTRIDFDKLYLFLKQLIVIM